MRKHKVLLDSGSSVVPGDELVRCNGVENSFEYVPGEGTYRRKDSIFSSRVGTFATEELEEKVEGKRRSMCVVRSKMKKSNIVPTVGLVVTGYVERINHRFAKVTLVTAGSELLSSAFSGIIRKGDVRASDKDSVEMHKCFRPNDIVRAKVLSLGDVRSYFLTTAEVSLGVISAKSASGTEMIPVGWSEMKCPVTGLSEPRKVAKVD
eukprot:g93.t1